MKPFKALLAAIGACLLLSGCDIARIDSPERAAENYTCTPEQMTRALYETKQSIEVDNALVDGKPQPRHFGDYWYGAAIMRICTWKPERKA